MFCHYRNILGQPRGGVHSFRLHIGQYDFAIVDILLTFLGAASVSYFTSWPYFYSVLGFFLAGIALHWMFCVQTTLNKILLS